MSRALQSLLRAWAGHAQKIAFFLLLVAGSAAVGVAIAWPLWYFATHARGAYTAFFLILAAAGVVFLVVRAILRAIRGPREPAGPRRSALSALLAILQALILLSGLYLAAVLFSHGIVIFAVPLLLVSLGLLVLLGLARRAVKTYPEARSARTGSRHGSIMPKIRKE